MSGPTEDRLDLFLADADEQRPVLGAGLSADSAVDAPRPKKERLKEWRRVEENWDDLSLQGWAVIAPEGAAGESLLEAIAPLCRLREREQGAPVKVYRVRPDMTDREAAEWKQDHFWPEGTPEEDVPLYAMILGDLHEVSAELQHVLATNTLVGRAHFARSDGTASLDDYSAYAEKVVRFAEEGTEETAPDFLFFTAPDGSAATVTGKARLVMPSIALCREKLAAGTLPAAAVQEIDAESVDGLCAAVSGPRPSVLLSLSHGLGPPRSGFPSEHHKWQSQGAMVIERSEVLDAERMRGCSFLPGGLWFYLACYGAGTPRSSAYHAWLSQLSEAGAYGGSLRAVLKALPGEGDRPFVAALPQAALASPRGPLAVIGHLDLAWTYGFSGIKRPSESRKSRILAPLEKVVRGHRAGVALGRLMMEYGEINSALMNEYQDEKDARIKKRHIPLEPAEQAHRWMLRNDLRGYVLLGDPAVRLPLRQHTLARSRSASSAVSGSAGAGSAVSSSARASSTMPGVATGPAAHAVAPPRGEPWSPAGGAAHPPGALTPEQAVLALWMGDTAPRILAERAGVSLEVLWRWVDEYRAAGRSAL